MLRYTFLVFVATPMGRVPNASVGLFFFLKALPFVKFLGWGQPIMLTYNKCVSQSCQLYTRFAVDKVKIKKVDVILVFFQFMQIRKTSIMEDHTK